MYLKMSVIKVAWYVMRVNKCSWVWFADEKSPFSWVDLLYCLRKAAGWGPLALVIEKSFFPILNNLWNGKHHLIHKSGLGQNWFLFDDFLSFCLQQKLLKPKQMQNGKMESIVITRVDTRYVTSSQCLRKVISQKLGITGILEKR